MRSKSSRREFLKVTAVAGVGFWVAGGVSRADNPPGPNERLNIAIIGAGGRGAGNWGAVAGTENIVAICDVDEQRAANCFNRFPRAQRFQDYRQMFDRVRNIDAVMVSTPDHHHFHPSLQAIRLGKHVYCEKPLTHSVWEARMLKEAASQYRVATQMGNQGTATNGFRQGVEIIRSGVLGSIREVHVWTNRPIWPQGIGRPNRTDEVPPHLNWDLWLGPAPERPYVTNAYHPFNWRGWWDFGTGAIGDMACHTMNLPFMALQLGAPLTVEAELTGNNPQATLNETAPVGCIVTYTFAMTNVCRGPRSAPAGDGGGNRGRDASNGQPGAAAQPPAAQPPAQERITLKWYERNRPPAELLQGEQVGGSGCLIVGSRGTYYTRSDYGDGYVLLPRAQFQGYRPPDPTLPRSPGHHAEWLRACKGGPPAMSNFDYASALTEMALLGNVAIRVGRRINWDSAQLRATGLPAADQYIRRQYRRGWEVT